jgi:hypothetical protein
VRRAGAIDWQQIVIFGISLAPHLARAIHHHFLLFSKNIFIKNCIKSIGYFKFIKKHFFSTVQ